MNRKDIIATLEAACDAAAAETLPRFRAQGDVVNKLDEGYDPVTEADRAAEDAIRKIIRSRHESHGIIGEEHGIERPDAEWQWIIDPIDGTRAFISGIPVWGTLIGLYHRGVPVAGVMDQPFTGERYFGHVSRQADLNDESWLQRAGKREGLATRTTPTLDRARLMTTTPEILRGEADLRYFEVEKRVELTRYGADCYAYCLLAAGQIDLVIESGLNIYDIAALIPIIEAAGGIVSDWRGGSAARGGQVLAAANRDVHREALAVLSG